MKTLKVSVLILALAAAIAGPASAQQASRPAAPSFSVASTWNVIPSGFPHDYLFGPLLITGKTHVNTAKLSPQTIRNALNRGPWCKLKKGGDAYRIPGPAKVNNPGTDFRLVFSSRVLPAIQTPPKGGCWAATTGRWETKVKGKVVGKGQNAYLFKVER